LALGGGGALSTGARGGCHRGSSEPRFHQDGRGMPTQSSPGPDITPLYCVVVAALLLSAKGPHKKGPHKDRGRAEAEAAFPLHSCYNRASAETGPTTLDSCVHVCAHPWQPAAAALLLSRILARRRRSRSRHSIVSKLLSIVEYHPHDVRRARSVCCYAASYAAMPMLPSL
jgi:hypothetical protein